MQARQIGSVVARGLKRRRKEKVKKINQGTMDNGKKIECSPVLRAAHGITQNRGDYDNIYDSSLGR
jgi:hypothetical protein